WPWMMRPEPAEERAARELVERTRIEAAFGDKPRVGVLWQLDQVPRVAFRGIDGDDEVGGDAGVQQRSRGGGSRDNQGAIGDGEELRNIRVERRSGADENRGDAGTRAVERGSVSFARDARKIPQRVEQVARRVLAAGILIRARAEPRARGELSRTFNELR